MYEISRIDKLKMDLEGITQTESLRLRSNHKVTLKMGDDVSTSRSLQLAVLTAARIAIRCYPSSVSIKASNKVKNSKCLVGVPKNSTFGNELKKILGKNYQNNYTNSNVILFGNTHHGNGRRVTFDGWVGLTGPENKLSKLREREYCSLSPILASALAISEDFFCTFKLNNQARHRVIGLSLWNFEFVNELKVLTDISQCLSKDAWGPKVKLLPAELWVLGLGHLGNANIWALSTLPYADPSKVKLNLMDFDHIKRENIETSILFSKSSIGKLKTRFCSKWLESMRFKTILVERRLGQNFWRHPSLDPAIVLCGVDSNYTRRMLPKANFKYIADSGFGGDKNNFHIIGFHTWPNSLTANEIWPDLEVSQENIVKEAEKNPAYTEFKGLNCGLLPFANKAIAIPFVGVVASTIVISSLLRMSNGGKKYENLKVKLNSLLVENNVPKKFSRNERAILKCTIPFDHGLSL